VNPTHPDNSHHRRYPVQTMAGEPQRISDAMSSEAELAWTLADVASTCFTQADHIGVYTALGAGESYSAIVRTLAIAARSRCSLPAKLVRELATWLDGYAGHENEPQIRSLLDAYSPSRRRRLRRWEIEGARDP
jgi:hypothetical protein